MLYRIVLKNLLMAIFKVYLYYKTITSQNVSSEAQSKNFFDFVEKVCFVLKKLKFCIFNQRMIYQICDVMISIST